MNQDVYRKLARALDKLPNGFPKTKSGIEIAILKRIFSPEEAALACQLSGEYESVNEMAKRVKITSEKLESALRKMAKHGLVWDYEDEGVIQYRLAPFIVGIFESQLDSMSHELAHMIEEYFAEGGAAGIMKPQPALHRVIPSQGAVKSEWILPYDDVKAVLQSQKTFSLRDCICRVQQDLIKSRRCNFPVKTCLTFSTYERPPRSEDISKEEALALLDKFEKIGLVHTVSNVMEGFSYVCNCCGCCCGILRGINDWGTENSVAYANYYSEIDPDQCKGCGTCIKRCQVKAISKQGNVSVVDRKRCIGCGLCVTGCTNGAAKLHRKPKEETINPPLDFETWEHERLHNRGMGQK
jgi:electron transport complex protein RnfB